MDQPLAPALAQFLAEFKRVSSAIVDSYFVVDRERRIVEFNRAFYALLPRQLARGLKGKHCFEVLELNICKYDVHRRAVLGRATATSASTRSTAIVVGDAQRKLRFILSAVPITDEHGNHVGALEIQRNVTDEAVVQVKYQEMLETEARERERLANQVRARTKELLETNQLLLKTPEGAARVQEGTGGVRAALAAAVLAGCFHPTAAADQPCSSGGFCPDGQRCDMTASPPMCVVGDGGTVGGGDGSNPPPVDARVADAPGASDAGGSVSCDNDGDCSSGVCSQFEGACVPELDAIYVDTRGHDSGTCPRPAPCATVSYALTQVDGARRVVHVNDGDYADSVTIADHLGASTDTVVIIGETDDGAELEGGSGIDIQGADVRIENFGVDGTSNGVLLEGGCTVVLAGVWLTGGADDGVKAANNGDNDVTVEFSDIADNNNFGVHLRNGTLTMDADTVIDNGGGGVLVQNNGTMDVTNSIVVQNGGSGSTTGGIAVQDQAKITTLAFDTIADNTNNASRAGGVACGNEPGGFEASNDILGGSTAPQTNCPTRFSLFVDPLDAGGDATDLVGDPAYVDEANGDYHITATSAARSAADPGATMDHDVDDEDRPQGSARDIGADEIQ